MSYDGLPRMEFAFPGPLRDALVRAVLDGLKVSTTSLRLEYELGGTPLPVPGKRSVVVDSKNRPVALIETTSVEVVRLGDVDLAHAIDEGEGFESVTDWRAGHEEFWHSDDMDANSTIPCLPSTTVQQWFWSVFESLNQPMARPFLLPHDAGTTASH